MIKPSFRSTLPRARCLFANDRFADDVRKIGPDHEVHRNPYCEQSRTRQKATSYSEEPSQDADNESYDHQVVWTYVSLRDQEIHNTYARFGSVGPLIESW